jgi:hypothetical protein
MASSQGTQLQHPFLVIYSADEHRTIYSFPNTNSYCTFYAFFSSFRITLWPMWLANSKRQPCVYPPQSHTQEDIQNWQKNWQIWWENCAVADYIHFSFSCIFNTVKLHSLGRVSGPFRSVFWEILGFCCEVDGNWVLVDYCAGSNVSSLLMFRNSLLVPSSGINNTSTLRFGFVTLPDGTNRIHRTTVSNHHYVLTYLLTYIHTYLLTNLFT